MLVSAGFDSHAADPVGSLGLETEDFAELTRIVLDVAERPLRWPRRERAGRRLQPARAGRVRGGAPRRATQSLVGSAHSSA